MVLSVQIDDMFITRMPQLMMFPLLSCRTAVQMTESCAVKADAPVSHQLIEASRRNNKVR